MKRRLVLLVFLQIGLLLPGRPLALAQTPTGTDTMITTNQLYESGRYREAVEAYLQLLDTGLANSTIYYNLGNAYYKQNDLGRAILYYQTALEIDPRDLDVQANLRFARDQTIDQLDDGNEAALVRLIKTPRSVLTLNEMAALALALWFVLGATLIVLALERRERFRRFAQTTAIVALVLVTLSTLTLGSELYIDRTHQDAVIIASEVDVLSGPGSQYVTEFTLHSGAEVRLIEERKGWTRLALSGGQLQGWVPSGDLARVRQTRDG